MEDYFYIILIVFFLLWIVFAGFVGELGEKRDCGYFKPFILSFFLSPVAGLLMVIASKDLDAEYYKKDVLRLLQENIDTKKAILGIDRKIGL